MLQRLLVKLVRTNTWDNRLLYTGGADGHVQLDHAEGEHNHAWKAAPSEEPNGLARKQCRCTLQILSENFSCTHYIVCALVCHLLYIAWKLTKIQHHHAVELSPDYIQI